MHAVFSFRLMKARKIEESVREKVPRDGFHQLDDVESSNLHAAKEKLVELREKVKELIHDETSLDSLKTKLQVRKSNCFLSDCRPDGAPSVQNSHCLLV